MTLHLANLTLRLCKDELGFATDNVSPVRFWMRSLPGAGDGHDRCLTCLGSKHAEVAFVDEASSHGGKMIILELRPGSVTSTKGRSSVASASIWFSFWLQTDEDYFRWWHGWSEDYSGGKPSREPTLEGPSLLLHSKTS